MAGGSYFSYSHLFWLVPVPLHLSLIHIFLLENGKIETTVTRAKEVRSLTEKMITIAKENNLHNQRLVMAFVTKEGVTHKLFTEIAPKYADRKGGYTRITKLGPRRGDAAEMAIIELL